MKIDLDGAPTTAALVKKHEVETAALPTNPDPLMLARHAQHQIIELLNLCASFERRYRGAE